MIARLYISGNISDRTEKAIEEHAIEQYMQLADVLQENILEGNLDFSTPVPNSRREILFKPDECIDTETQELEVSITSSMIKELSSLVLYLRYEAKHGELLVIDEPEMNLHPAAQVKIIEFLAMLVNAGLHVLITTHSTYVIDHLVNLMDAYKHQNQDELVDIFLLQSKEAFIDQDKVSVYHIANGEAKNILDAEGIIDWQTFSDVTRLVQRIHYEL
jgi:predicted ATPase